MLRRRFLERCWQAILMSLPGVVSRRRAAAETGEPACGPGGRDGQGDV